MAVVGVYVSVESPDTLGTPASTDYSCRFWQANDVPPRSATEPLATGIPAGAEHHEDVE